MAFSTSVNIERDFGKVTPYIVTANARQAIGKIVCHFADGIHSFCLIGSYGTGKSSFIVALENCMRGANSDKDSLIQINGQFNGFDSFDFLNIVGEYNSLSKILSSRLKTLNADDKSIFAALNHIYARLQKQKKFLVIVIDEFGKVLEHAAKNNPEQEMYFLQQFCEWVNDSNKNVILLTTLHQGFGAYAKGLTTEQRQEWTKVKGRLHDIVFTEPIEQLLNLTAQRLNTKVDDFNKKQVKTLFNLAVESKFIDNELKLEVAEALYPLDIFAAYVLTKANQRYGQNERTLFTFLESTGVGAVSSFKTSPNCFYNLVDVYEYISYNFYTYLQEINEDSTNWAAIYNAIERVEGLPINSEKINTAIKLVKIIGLLNIFASASTTIDADFLKTYCSNAVDQDYIADVLATLESAQIIRYAKYKSKYILFEGTDVDIEAGLYEAARVCKQPTAIAERLADLLDNKLMLANAYFFKTGTPRFFQYSVTAEPIEKVDKGEIDGYINLLFQIDHKERCLQVVDEAIIYCIYKDTQEIVRHLHEIDKLIWVREYYITDHNDKVALREIENLIEYEKTLLNKSVLDRLFTNDVEWIFNSELLSGISSEKRLVNTLSMVCETVYPSTPVYRNELINKHRPNGVMSLARQNYLTALLENISEPNLGFEDNKFPPEKTIYLSLLVNTGILVDGRCQAPNDFSFAPLWNACNDFLKSSVGKPRKISELYAMLSSKPFRLKQGFLDVWVPTYLILRKDDFALYTGQQYIPYINKEVIDLILRSPSNYTLKAFSVDGVRRDFFDKYREAINLSSTELNGDTFIETIRPFLTFYKKLNNYAKHTKDLSALAKGFRDVIATATDPEKTFFEALPDAMGFKELALEHNPEAIDSFVEVLHNAIRELRKCYAEFVNSIEEAILAQLKIEPTSYAEYAPKISARFKGVKTQLMPLTTRNFYNRLVGRYEDKTSWIEAVSYVILNKPLQDIKDAEKSALLKGIHDTIFQLDDYVEMHKSDDVEMVRLHVTENSRKPFVKQVVLPKESITEVDSLEAKIRAILSDDIAVNTAALLRILKTK